MKVIKTRKRFDIVNYIPAILIVTAIVLVIVLLCVFLSGKTKSVDKDELQLLPFNSNSNYMAFAGGAVYIDNSNNQIFYVDDRNEVMWGYEGTVPEMKLYAGENKVGVAVGKKLQVIDKDGRFVFSKEFDKNISAVTLSDKLIAVSLSNSDDTIILNGTGEEIDRILSSVNGTNIRFGVYAKNSVWVISVENSGYRPGYQLSTYKYDTEKTQTVTFTDDSQMMYDAYFDDKICYIFGTEKIMVRDCDYTGSVHEDYTVNGYDVVACGKIDKNVHILLNNDGKIKAIGEKGVLDIKCEEKLNFVTISEEYYYGFSEYFMYKIDPSDGEVTKYRFPVRIDNVIQGEGYAIIQSGNDVYRYGYDD